MNYILFFCISFFIVYMIYFIFVIKRKKSIEKLKTSLEVRFLVNKYKINLEKVNINKLANRIALCNSFIISLAFLIILFVENFILKMLVGFVALFPLILIVYHILGKSLKKKEGN